ncbi:MAG: hypothetical protein CMH49_05080 [Myxococcales bacterium]|nr:hypothetical protein [Myxococcales bacterium]
MNQSNNKQAPVGDTSVAKATPDDHQTDTQLATNKRRRRRKKKKVQEPLDAAGVEVTQKIADFPRGKAQVNSKSTAKGRRSKGQAKEQTRGSKQKVKDPIEQALRLLDSAIRQEAKKTGVLRLSPLHLDLIIGAGENLNHQPDQEAIQRQIKKVKQRINEELATQIPTQWRRGTVFCFHSEQAISPPSHDAVFTGYDTLGRPQWQRLLPLCLQRQVEHLERLYAQPAEAIALMMKAPIGEALISEITAGRLYDVLAQVVIGPISDSFKPLRQEDERYTLTAQMILSKPQERKLSIHLNILGLDPDDIYEAAAKAAPRGPLARARNCILSAQKEARKLQELLNLKRVNHDRLPDEAEKILSHLRDSLFRVLKGDLKRTHHAKTRHHSMERPTSEAWRDAKRAGNERLFWDQHQETVVVVGPKGRVHVFSLDARHVTSMRLGAGELERKTGQGRWRPLIGEQVRTFKFNLNQSRQSRMN